jgi:hypothetical protein
MSNKIDLNIWVTQQALADELGVPIQNVHNWVQRNKIEWQYLPNSKIKVVNRYSISIDYNHHKRN